MFLAVRRGFRTPAAKHSLEGRTLRPAADERSPRSMPAAQVWIGKEGYGWSTCEVIEGACSVDCGSMYRIVCDTTAFVPTAVLDDPTAPAYSKWTNVRSHTQGAPASSPSPCERMDMLRPRVARVCRTLACSGQDGNRPHGCQGRGLPVGVGAADRDPP